MLKSLFWRQVSLVTLAHKKLIMETSLDIHLPLPSDSVDWRHASSPLPHARLLSLLLNAWYQINGRFYVLILLCCLQLLVELSECFVWIIIIRSCFGKEKIPLFELYPIVLQVKARATTREVMATYTIEDIVIELIIQLPSNYPLGSITVESGKRVGVAVQQWRNWMLQLSTYLTHQVRVRFHGLSDHRAAVWEHSRAQRSLLSVEVKLLG